MDIPPPLMDVPPPPPPGFGGPPPPPGMGGPLLAQVKLPERKVPKPNSQMRKLFWQKIPPSKINDTIWADVLKEETVYLDFAAVEKLFCQEEKGKPVVTKKESNVVQILKGDKLRGVNVTIKQLRRAPEQVCADISNADVTHLSVEALKTFANFVPSEEDITQLKEFSGSLKTLSEADQLYRQLVLVPLYGEKLRFLSFKLEFDGAIAEIGGKLDTLHKAVKELMESKRLKKLLAVILDVGNFLNNKTPQGNSYGYKVSALLKLTSVKSPLSASLSVLDFIVEFLAEKDTQLFNWAEEVPSLEKASLLSLDLLEKDLGVTRVNFNSAVQLEEALKKREQNSRFLRVVSVFVTRARVELNQRADTLSELKSNAVKLASLFGETLDGTNITLEIFLNIFQQFTKSFTASREVSIKKREKEKKEKECSSTTRTSTRSARESSSTSQNPNKATRTTATDSKSLSSGASKYRRRSVVDNKNKVSKDVKDVVDEIITNFF